MEIYADFDYYMNKYKGTMEHSSFERYSVQASLKIKNFTHGRATSDIEEVKQCMCELADAIYEDHKTNSNISSEKVDNYTRNFVVKSEADRNKAYYIIVSQHLGRLGLLHGGVPCVY